MKSRMHFVQEFRDSFVLERIVMEGTSCNDVVVFSKLFRWFVFNYDIQNSVEFASQTFIAVDFEQKIFQLDSFSQNIYRFSLISVIYLVKNNWL